MSIIYANGFEEGIVRFTASANASVSTTTPRSGLRKCLMNNVSVFAASFGYVDHANITTGWVYAAFKPLTQWQAAHPVISITDVGTANPYLWFRNDRRFELRQGATVLATGTYIVNPGEWVHICCEIVIANSGGVYKVYLNGSSTPDINFSGDTQGGANAYWNRTYFGNWDNSQFSSITLEMDDLIIQDNAGTAPENARLGDVGIDAALPDGDGDDVAWDIGGSSPAATRWQSVDEIPADDGVTLIEGDVVGERNLCTHAAVSTTIAVATFIAAMLVARVQKVTATDKKIKLCNKSGVTVGYGPEVDLTLANVDQAAIFHDDPGGSAWTDTNFNGAQAGVEVTV